ncbi:MULTISPECIES: cupin domain-containing protein [Asticcacaulis]|uniref:cupin domain-containing protein n=1 Tax=Asticcacaulis TaxID=76890 RepID=UPI001AE4574F|nr:MULTISPECIES: cupin domain-containing protein [Asticcacaulis]MBP2157462.1 mannose-6-phosphate isomerase-like protein (cupin superfamily) [Asticcacaulis solisilvae]MDR6798507.1 mannose-6-phosphate isomerase-like protein (cupin superfamily) [Asticcacaulis sp. BE141]
MARNVTLAARAEADPAFAAKIAYFEGIFHALHQEPEPVERPDAIWDRIERAIDDQEKSPDTRTVRPEAMGWEPYAPLITRKIVHLDAVAGVHTAFYRLEPGAEVISHTHLLIEECLVVEGEIEADGVVVRAGEVHLAPPGSRHILRSPKGATVYLRGDLEIQL